MAGKVELAREVIFNAAKGIVTMFPTLRRVHTQIRVSNKDPINNALKR